MQGFLLVLSLTEWSKAPRPVLHVTFPLLLKNGLFPVTVRHCGKTAESQFIFLACSTGGGESLQSFFSSMTQQIGKLSRLNAQLLSQSSHLCQQKRAQGYQRLTALRDSSGTRQEIMPHLCHLIATYLQLCTFSVGRSIQNRGHKAFISNHPMAEMYFE